LEEDGNPVSVGGFIGGCEQSGLIQALDIKSLELALKELTLCPDLYLSLNVSPLTFLTPFWLDMLRNSLSSMPDVAKRLMIEVTENSIMFDLDKIVEFFSIIQSLGSKVAIDDFGAGYIPMGILKDHIVDVIKIDKQYTQHVENNKNNLNMIRALQSLLTPHGIKVVAEGVETLSCIEILKQESIDALQGYYFGKPSIIRPWIP
jgi:EAL domain-containing protein (putative c-di-GMP-specific phosphodiesterase class I)